MDLAIVVPCYNEQEVLKETAARLTTLLGDLCSRGKISAASLIYFVDDGSRDQTWPMIETLAVRHNTVRGVKLSKNQGHQRALFAGLSVCEGDAVVSIDADLQDDVGVIEQMVDAYHAGHDIVYGVRNDRHTDSWFKRASAESYYRLLRAVGVNLVFNHADFRLLSRRALDNLLRFSETNLFIRGLIPLLGFRSASVYYSRGERFAGKSKYPLRKSLSLALEGITSFSIVPLRMITVLGLLVFLVSSALGLWGLWLKFFTNYAIPGWASTVIPIYFLGAVQLLGIGVIGEYLGKIYLEVKARPRFIIEKSI